MRNKGFTLIEVLLVVALIAILAGIVIIAINPSKQLGDANDTQRKADVNTIINAVYQYSIDNGGTLPAGIEEDSGGDCPANDGGVDSGVCVDGGTCSGLVNLYDDLVGASSTYLVDIPTDPAYSSGDDTLYDIVKDASGRVTVCAPSANTGTIEVKR